MGQSNNLLFLKNFNKAIDNVSEEIKTDKYMKNSNFYSFIKSTMDMICRKMSYQDETSNEQIEVIQKDKMFEVVLDFLKSIDIEFYDKALEILENKYPNTKTYIYDFHKDDPHHSTCYNVYYEKERAEIRLPLGYRLSENEANEINLKYGEDFYTIDDLYSITHEISHLFDIIPENYTDYPSQTRDVLTEVTPGIFELFLSEYLLEKGIFDENIIKDKNSRTNNRLLTHANMCRLKLGFLELKGKKGEITEEDIELIKENDILTADKYVDILNLIVRYKVKASENKRYAFCGMCAPIIFQKCQTDVDKKLLKKYLDECSQNIPFTDILNGFGIDLKREIDKYKDKDNIER